MKSWPSNRNGTEARQHSRPQKTARRYKKKCRCELSEHKIQWKTIFEGGNLEWRDGLHKSVPGDQEGKKKRVRFSSDYLRKSISSKIRKIIPVKKYNYYAHQENWHGEKYCDAARMRCRGKCNWQMLISINSRLRLFIGYIHKRGFNWPRIRLIFKNLHYTDRRRCRTTTSAIME